MQNFQLRLFGHIMIMPGQELSKLSYDVQMDGGRPRERYRSTWEENTQAVSGWCHLAERHDHCS